MSTIPRLRRWALAALFLPLTALADGGTATVPSTTDVPSVPNAPPSNGSTPAGAPAAPGTPGTAAQQDWNLHGQFTDVTQFHPRFASPYQGVNSLTPGGSAKATNDITLYAGLRLWQGAAVYANPEIDQGFGLSNTVGVAGFPSGEAYKIGASNPYYQLQRLFLRQVIAIGSHGTTSAVSDDLNQLAGTQADDNVTITIGKLSVVDIFDNNRYAHDPRNDFLNWSIIDSGAFDYAANAWGYTDGGAVEWNQGRWTLRGGFFALSSQPNGTKIDTTFHQFEWVSELEERHQIAGHPGKIRFLVYDNRGRFGAYDAALAYAELIGATPSTATVRRFASNPGGAVNAEQEITSDLGAFLRLSVSNGQQEAYDFTEIDKSLATGLSLQGTRWHRANDTAGFALVVNGLSHAAQQYFAAGGTGIVIGDGRLNYGTERIAETYYAYQAWEHITVTGDYQLVVNPAYNRDRGPVSIFGLRLHAEY